MSNHAHRENSHTHNVLTTGGASTN